MQLRRYAVMQICSYVDMQLRRYAVTQICSYADMQFHSCSMPALDGAERPNLHPRETHPCMY